MKERIHKYSEEIVSTLKLRLREGKKIQAILIFGLWCLNISTSISCNKVNNNSLNCEFTYDDSTTQFQWTAFKLTEKVGVKGTFDKISIEGIKDKQKSIALVFENLKFYIDINSINSGQIERDKKILKYFFGSLQNSKELSGVFSKIKISGDSGTADLTLKMNGIEKTIPVQIIVQKNSDLEIRASIDLLNWDMDKSIIALNKECNDLHKGKDSISKLWPDVELKVNTKLKAICQ